MIHLLFFAALVSTANGLTCDCSGVSGCSKNATCTVTTGSGKCFSFTGTSQAGKDVKVNDTQKGCQNDADTFKICDEGYVSITALSEYFLRTNVTCCTTDNCNKDLPELKQNNTQNNLVCPSCFAFNKDTCEPQKANCTGSQTQCLNVTGSITDGTSSAVTKFVGKGCATPTAIFLKNSTGFLYGNFQFTLHDVSMEKANNAHQLSSCLTSVSLLLSTMGLLLTNTLY